MHPSGAFANKIREFKNICLALFLMSVIAATLFFLCGGSLDGILYDHWLSTNDHPTNWLDSALHP